MIHALLLRQSLQHQLVMPAVQGASPILLPPSLALQLICLPEEMLQDMLSVHTMPLLFGAKIKNVATAYHDMADKHMLCQMQAGVSRSGGSFGVNSALLELDKEADDRYHLNPMSLFWTYLKPT